jgi:Tol biopolymer transport system component
VAQPADPRLSWRTLDTPHFQITFHEPLEPLAQRLAQAAEHAHAVLAAALGLTTSERTLILLTDDTDAANGRASVLPRNAIHLFAAAPDDLSAIGDYDEWVTLLVTHEHTHILHLDQIGGLAAVINAIFGKTMAPNAIAPRWLIEGIATYEESARTSGGRLRSTIFDMYLRMDALEDRIPTLAQLSNDPERWPHGELRYLYGSHFVAMVVARYGERALGHFARDYGRQLFPYGLNRIATRVTGRTFVELYDDFKKEIRDKYRAQAETIRARGVIEGKTLVPHSDYLRSPRYLRDGRLLYFADDGRTQPGLFVREHDGTRRRLVRTAGQAYAAPHPDGSSVVYSQAAPTRDLYDFHDLFVLDLGEGTSERLTHGMRAREPDVSPDGREVAFVTQASGTSRLEIAALDDIAGTRRTLLHSLPFEQVFTPRYSPDGSRIACSVVRKGGYRDVVIIERATGTVRQLMRDRAQDTGPAWAPDGHTLYYASDRSGVSNIHAFDLHTETTTQLTNVIAGAYQPTVTSDGSRLSYLSYESRGFGVSELDLVPSRSLDPLPYTDTRPDVTLPAAAPPRPVRDYDPWPSLLPRAYRLELQEGPVGFELGVQVTGHDLARFHDYAVRAAVSLETGDPSVTLRYTYGRTPLFPSLRLFREVATRYDLEVGGLPRKWIEERVGGQVALSYRFASLLRSVWLDLDYALFYVDNVEPFTGVLDPNDPPPRLPERGFIPRAGLGVRYSDVARVAYDISPSYGRTVGVSLGLTDPLMGRDFRSVIARWTLRQFFALPMSQHVLALRYAGGLSGGDPGRINYFALGGYPDESAFSLYDFLVFGAVTSNHGEALRGYPAGYRIGSQMQHVQAEYRLPLFDPEWGIYTLPAYVRRVWGTVFVDAGNAWVGSTALDDFLVGAGAELYASFVISYRVTFLARLGFAHGFSEGGEDQMYFHLGAPF